MAANKSNHTDDHLPAPFGLLVAFGLAVVVALALAALAVSSFRRPAVKLQAVERLRYEHTMTFEYTAQVVPSALYEGESIGPVTAPPDAETSVSQPPLFTRLAKSLDLGFTYALVTAQPGAPLAADVAGQISAALQIKAGEKPDEGWTKTLPLEPAAITFTGPTAAARVIVDFPAVLRRIDAIERETDFKPAVYEVAVIPTVEVKGTVGPQAVDETFAPAFTMKLNRTQITLDPKLRRSEVKSTRDNVPVEQYLDLLGLSLPVPLARHLTAVGTALAVLAAAVLAAVIFLGLGRDEMAKIRARYGTMLVSVAGTNLNDALQRVEVASIHDLARLAKRDGGAIFHQELTPRLHLYFVPEGTVTYEYVMVKGAGTPSEVQSAAKDEAGDVG